MKENLTQAPCLLQLVPYKQVVRFAELHEEAYVQYYTDNLVEVDLTPGSLKLSDTPGNDGMYTKKHSFKVPATGLDMQRKLKELGSTYLVALYKDEKNRQKVSGSPLYPLTLKCQPSGGTLTCTLEGKTPWMDLFVAED